MFDESLACIMGPNCIYSAENLEKKFLNSYIENGLIVDVMHDNPSSILIPSILEFNRINLSEINRLVELYALCDGRAYRYVQRKSGDPYREHIFDGCSIMLEDGILDGGTHGVYIGHDFPEELKDLYFKYGNKDDNLSGVVSFLTLIVINQFSFDEIHSIIKLTNSDDEIAEMKIKKLEDLVMMENPREIIVKVYDINCNSKDLPVLRADSQKVKIAQAQVIVNYLTGLTETKFEKIFGDVMYYGKIPLRDTLISRLTEFH